MKTLLKPKALKKGDRLAAVSLSWGGAGLFRQRYEQGKRQFEQAFGVQIVEMPHTLDTPEEIYAHPENRLSVEAKSAQDFWNRLILISKITQQITRWLKPKWNS